jgi:hypothetical protein
VNRIVAIAVAIALFSASSPLMPLRAKSVVRNGTWIMPPPMPSRPASQPVMLPISSNSAMKSASINRAASTRLATRPR